MVSLRDGVVDEWWGDGIGGREGSRGGGAPKSIDSLRHAVSIHTGVSKCDFESEVLRDYAKLIVPYVLGEL